MNKIPENILRCLLIIVGTFFVGLGLIGIFLPVLPTTPFLLLASLCYARGSQRFYNWLLNNKLFGEYIKNYKEGRGITLKAKTITLILLWLMIGYSAFIIPIFLGKVILIIIAIGVTLHVVSIKTLKV